MNDQEAASLPGRSAWAPLRPRHGTEHRAGVHRLPGRIDPGLHALTGVRVSAARASPCSTLGVAVIGPSLPGFVFQVWRWPDHRRKWTARPLNDSRPQVRSAVTAGLPSSIARAKQARSHQRETEGTGNGPRVRDPLSRVQGQVLQTSVEHARQQFPPIDTVCGGLLADLAPVDRRYRWSGTGRRREALGAVLSEQQSQRRRGVKHRGNRCVSHRQPPVEPPHVVRPGVRSRRMVVARRRRTVPVPESRHLPP